MDTTAFIRKINGEVSRMKPGQTSVSAAQNQTTFNKKPKSDAAKSTKPERAKVPVPGIYSNGLRVD
jgi:hypothetical protein